MRKLVYTVALSTIFILLMSLPGQAQTITGCLTWNKSELYNVQVGTTPSADCKRRDTTLSWDQVGMPGVDGDDGMDGDDGAQGPQGPPGEPPLPECTVDGQVTKWSDSEQNWVCASDNDTDTDTLATLFCTQGQLAKFNGMVWECVADQGEPVPTCNDGQILKWNANNTAWECADIPTASPALFMVDSQGQEIGIVIDATFESVSTAPPQSSAITEATVATELAGNLVLLGITPLEIRGRGQADIGNGGVVFTDSICQTAYIRVNPPGDRFFAPLTVVEAPGLTVYVAQPGSVVNLTPTHVFDSFGQCNAGGFGQDTYLPATAIANLDGDFFTPFSLRLK